MTAPIRSMPELVAALRARRDELQLTHETIDAIAGWPSGYAGKLLAPEPIKNLGWSSLGLALNTFGIALVVVEDEEQKRRVEKRWTPRERPQRAPLGIALSIEDEVPQKVPVSAEFMRKIGSSGGKARMKKMTRAQRVKIARKAIVTRWRRQRERERAAP
jgi:hypothetical protein